MGVIRLWGCILSFWSIRWVGMSIGARLPSAIIGVTELEAGDPCPRAERFDTR